MPTEDLTPAIELFRHRFLHALRETKLISPKKLTDLLSWKHCGFLIHDGAPDLDWLNRPRKPLHSQPGWL